VNRVERDLRKRLIVLSLLIDRRIVWTPRQSEGLQEFKGQGELMSYAFASFFLDRPFWSELLSPN
jgi:hypothetical protein